jgi:hypothetical protein
MDGCAVVADGTGVGADAVVVGEATDEVDDGSPPPIPVVAHPERRRLREKTQTAFMGRMSAT